jgi:DNA (cytosine-5)-methyltransferase 1
MRPLTFGSLFAGAGGFDLGFEASGLRCLFQVEIDRQAREVLSHRWPAVPKFDDVRTCGRKNLPAVDVLVGGFPCQDLSVAGNREGLSGERSGLFYELARIARELRPRLLVWENVPGLLSSDDGRDFARVLRHLGDGGYHGVWRVLDAQHFGVPQQRRRVFGVFARGRAGAVGGPQVLALADGLRRHPSPGREAGADVAGTVTGRARQPGGDEAGSGLVVFKELGEGHATYQEAEAAGSQRAGGGGAIAANLVVYGGNDTSGPPRAAACLSAKGGTGRQDFESENFVLAFNCKDDGAGGDVSPTLRAMGHRGSHANAGGQVAGDAHGHRTHALTASGSRGATEDGTGRGTPIVMQCHGSNVADQTPALVDGATVRRLTPRECERLMGWPDDHTRYGKAGRELKDGPRYRLIGNGVAAPVAEWIGRRIVAALPPEAA